MSKPTALKSHIFCSAEYFGFKIIHSHIQRYYLDWYCITNPIPKFPSLLGPLSSLSCKWLPADVARAAPEFSFLSVFLHNSHILKVYAWTYYECFMRDLFSVRGNSSIKINLLLLDLMLDLAIAVWQHSILTNQNNPGFSKQTIRTLHSRFTCEGFFLYCVYKASFITKRHYKASLIRLSDPILR